MRTLNFISLLLVCCWVPVALLPDGWFKVLAILGLSAFMFLDYRFRVRRLRVRAERLHTLVEERTRDLEERNKELEAIERTIRTINREIELEKLLESMLSQAMQLVSAAEKGGFLIYDKVAGVFRAAALEGYEPAAVSQVSLSYEEAMQRYTMGSQQVAEGVYIVRELSNLAGAEKLKDLPRPKVMLVMSLILDRQVEGFLILENMTDAGAFDESGAQTLCRLREHALSALSRAKTLDQLENRVKERTSELLRAKEGAEKANRAKSLFLANMSHEIRTPMNAILGFTEIMLGEEIDDKQKKYLSSISASGKTLLELIDDLLDLSRIEAGKLELHHEPVNPRIVMEDIKTVFSSKVKEKGLDFRMEMDPGLPKLLVLDNLRTRQILLNLVGNAVKFTHDGFVKLGLYKTGARPGSADITFVVEDSGIGIPAGEIQSLFEAFARSEKLQKDKYGGTGLGLSITRRLVEMMEGEIAVSGEEGKGSMFRVSLKDVAVSGSVEEEAVAKPLDLKTLRMGKATILVVDDEAMNRDLMSTYLTRQNLEVITAENGMEAVEMVKQRRPGLVLMDIKMPVMNGLQATRMIKADEELKHIPVIFTTAQAMREQVEEMEKAGGDAYLIKPLSKSKLFALLIRFLPYTIAGRPAKEGEPRRHKEALGEADQLPLDPLVRERLPELLEILESRFMPYWEEIRKTFVLDDFEDFAARVKELGAHYQVSVLENWGRTLVTELQSFDTRRITKTLEVFPRLIDEIAALAVS
jgi:signal transduction histidine kinase/FixJ family two-component response regulator